VRTINAPAKRRRRCLTNEKKQKTRDVRRGSLESRKKVNRAPKASEQKTVVYPVLRRRNRGNATLISWSRFLRVLQGRATICRPPRPGGTSAFWILFFPFFLRLSFRFFAEAEKKRKKIPSFRRARGIAKSRNHLKTQN